MKDSAGGDKNAEAPYLPPKSIFSAGISKSVPLLQFFFVRGFVFSYVAFFLSLSVIHVSFYMLPAVFNFYFLLNL